MHHNSSKIGKLQPILYFHFLDFHFQIAKIEYRGQTRYTSIIDCDASIQSDGWGLVQSGGWRLITTQVTHYCPQFWRSKKNSKSTQFIELYFMVSEQIKPLQPIGQVWVQVQAPADQCRSSDNHSRRLFEKTIEGFDCKINGQAFGAAPAQVGRVGRASTNTGRFRVGGSRCGPRPVRLRKTCYHSCDTDSVRGFNAL